MYQIDKGDEKLLRDLVLVGCKCKQTRQLLDIFTSDLELEARASAITSTILLQFCVISDNLLWM